MDGDKIMLKSAQEYNMKKVESSYHKTISSDSPDLILFTISSQEMTRL